MANGQHLVLNMKIALITEEQHATLLKVQEDHPILTFFNEGYQYIKKDNFTPEDQKAFDKVTDILKDHIVGFSEFYNFRNTTNGIQLRFDYDYGASDNSMSFIGVGYLMLSDLVTGFKED